MVAEEENTLALTLSADTWLNPLAPAGTLPQSLDEANGTTLGVGTVVPAHDGLDGLGGFVSVVEGNGGDVVVEDVGLDNAVEKVTANEAKLTVDGSSGTTGVGPGLGVVVRQSGVGVLQEGDHDEPVVDPEVGEEVPDKKIVEAEVVANPDKTRNSEGDTEVTEQDQVLVTPLVQGARGVEVVDTAEEAVLLSLALALDLALVEVVAGNVGEEVQRPSSKLLANGVEESGDGSLFGQLADLVDKLANAGGINLTGLWDEDHVTLHVAGGLVVLAVGNLPREVGNKQERVADPANGVVESLGRREGLVTALVGKDPETSTEKTLEHGVSSPEHGAQRQRRNSLWGNVVVEDVEGGGKQGQVAGNVSQTTGSGALKAVLGNCIAELLDGIVGNLELVSVGVEKLAVGPLGLGLLVQRGQRRVGGRTGRGVKGRGRDGVGSRVGRLVPLHGGLLRTGGGGGHGVVGSGGERIDGCGGGGGGEGRGGEEQALVVAAVRATNCRDAGCKVLEQQHQQRQVRRRLQESTDRD